MKSPRDLPLMKLLHRVEHCFGFPLWKSSKRYVELWFCFSAVRPHSHPGQHSEIIPLFGWATFYRQHTGPGYSGPVQEVNISPRKWLQSFSIPAGWRHWFALAGGDYAARLRLPLVFLNIATGGPGVSAAHNFVLSKERQVPMAP